MSLEGEAGAAASKCPLVIDKNLLHQTLDLPHWTTANKMVEEAHAIAKVHVAEEVLKNQNVALHTDATSRQKKKYVGQQITLDSGRNLSLGFVEVATEGVARVVKELSAWIEEPEQLLQSDCKGVFDEEFLDVAEEKLEEIKEYANERKDLVVKVLKVCFEKMPIQVVTTRQLTEFLEDDAYEGLLDLEHGEAGIQFQQKPAKVIASKGQRSVSAKVSGNQDNITILATVNASGDAMSPMIVVYNRKDPQISELFQHH
ncbi:hypothetical protein ElyMa_004690600 [Elysia marginata]|uniref:DDE-1 domain-containing protein n=1 Tax=Elysia marginata TaxID=1093978 RepID=A0AAV4I787_9GAST|nr:hypothetical protein ElyMa_004690600 [Elysia marginata]